MYHRISHPVGFLFVLITRLTHIQFVLDDAPHEGIPVRALQTQQRLNTCTAVVPSVLSTTR
jgi:hypothetical protein